MNIRQEALGSYTMNYNTGEQDSFVIIDSEGFVITHTDNTKSGINVLEEEYFKKVAQGGQEGMLESRNEYGYHVISYEKSSLNNWYYVALASKESFYQQSRQIRNYLLLVGLLIILISLVLSVVMTKQANGPLKKIVSAVMKISMVMNKNPEINMDKSEYKILNNTVNNIAEKLDELSNQLEQNKPVIRHNAIIRLLSGARENTMERYSDLLDIQFPRPLILCFKIKIYNEKDLNFDYQMMVQYNLIKLMEREQSGYRVYSVLDNDGYVTGILNYDNQGELELITRELADRAGSLLSGRFTLGFGSSYKMEGGNICNSNNEAEECLQYTFIRSSEKVLFYTELKLDTLKEGGSLPRILDRFSDSLRAGEEAKIRFVTDGIIESVLSGDYKLEYCKNTLMEVVYAFRITLEDMGIDTMKLFGYDVREYFKSIETVEEYKDWIYDLIGMYLVVLNERKKGAKQDFDVKISDYIEANLYKDISLESMAGDFHFNPNYLSKVFKVVTGQNFSEYVTERKLQKAAELLRETQMSVKDISLRLGYSSINYFIRIFKKKYAYTPKEYQKSTIGEKSTMGSNQ